MGSFNSHEAKQGVCIHVVMPLLQQKPTQKCTRRYVRIW